MDTFRSGLNFEINVMFQTTFSNQDQLFKIMKMCFVVFCKKIVNQFLCNFEYVKQLFHSPRRYKDFSGIVIEYNCLISVT